MNEIVHKILCAAIVLAFTACNRPFVVVQIADAQFGFTASEKALSEGKAYDNDVQYERDCLLKAVELINEIKPDAVVFTGDEVHHADNHHEWAAFKECVSAISDDIELLYTSGNHDVLIKDGSVDTSPHDKYLGEGYFKHQDRNVLLLGINTNYIKYDDPREQEQYAWIEQTLEGNRDDNILIFGHHPFFLADIDEEDGYSQIQKCKRKRYFDLFGKYEVDAVFAGHLHNNAQGEYMGIPSITTTSVAFQIGGPHPSIRVITIDNGRMSSELLPL